MRRFIEINPGLKPRFTRYIDFPDYDEAELLEIFQVLCRNEGFELDENARLQAIRTIDFRFSNRSAGFGNAREMRTLFEQRLNNKPIGSAMIHMPIRQR